MAHKTPAIHNSKLAYQHNGRVYELTVGSPEWYAWLEHATSFSFSMNPHGSFTARRERSGNKRGGWYWKAYARRNGKLLQSYIGKAETLTFERLCAVAAQFSSSIQDNHAVQEETKTSRTREDLPRYDVSDLLQPQLTNLVGREQEAQAACALLRQSSVRLLTMTGPGGVGKTRLASHVAGLLAAEFADGICFVSLSAIADPGLVVPTLAQALGFVEAGEEPLLTRLIAFLRNKHMLLFLDNFEQVVDAAPALAELLAHCFALKLLVTSREVLHLRGEREFVLPPLALPDLTQRVDPSQLSQCAAVALFVQRAETVRADFRVTEENARAIAEICTRLDGLPLAIELAAARVKLLSPQLLLARLDRRLLVLTSGARDLPRRQQTLRDTLDWSYDLLNAEEQQLFRQLAVFVRGCTLEAAEAFCQMLHVDPSSGLERVASLIDKSLLQRIEQSNGDVRLMMLETIREYGQERLVDSHEEIAARQAHALYYLKLAELAAPQLRQARQVLWLNRLDRDYDNLRAALSWFFELQRCEELLRLCSALWLFWVIRDRRSEGLQWIERALAICDRSMLPAPVLADAMYAAGVLADSQGYYQRATALWTESLALYEQCNLLSGVAATFNRLGRVHARNAPVEAHDFYEKSLKLARLCGDEYAQADALASLADEASSLSDYNRAQALFQESLALYRRLEDKRSSAYCLGGLGHAAAIEGNHAEAQRFLEQSLALHREVGDRVGIAFGLIPLGMALLYRGEYVKARALLEESLTVSKELGNQQDIADYIVQYPQLEHYTAERLEQPLEAYGAASAASKRSKKAMNTVSSGLLDKASLLELSKNEAVRPLLEESLAYFRETGNEEEVASRLYSLGNIEFARGNIAAAKTLLEESLAIFRALDHRVMTATTLYSLGHIEAHRCNFAAARIFMEESLELTRQIDDRLAMFARLSYLGLVALNEGEYAEARVLFEKSLVFARDSEDQHAIGDALGVMALLPLNEGDFATARKLLEESMQVLQRSGDRSTLVYRLADMGMVELREGNMARARPFIEQALELSRDGNRWLYVSCLERLGEIVVESQPAWAVSLWGTAMAEREALSAPIPPIERLSYERAIARARILLEEDVFQSAWQRGYTSAPEQLLNALPAEALARSSEFNRIPDTPSSIPPFTNLTGREVEVLRLAAVGMTNAQIAAQLVISPRTVQTHLSSIYSKIGVSSRSAATRYAIEHHLS